jgi:hypothetical protein
MDFQETKHYLKMGNVIYDVTNYLDLHPGGREILLECCASSVKDCETGADHLDRFEEIGHSKDALSVLEGLPKLNTSDSHSSNLVKENSSFWSRSLRKLFTSEDHFHLHKAAGFFCLIHYVYRIVWAYTEMYRGKPIVAGLYPTYATIGLLLAHVYLSLSSFLFRLPREQQSEKPMIWQEFRAHNVMFAVRGLLCGIFSCLGWSIWANFWVIMATMFGADLATHYLGRSTKKTTRTLPYWEGCPPMVQRSLKTYYRFAQYEATITCLGDQTDTFLTVFPIQLASFLMTCVRKGLLTAKQYHFFYCLSLLTPQIIYLGSPHTMHILLMASLVYGSSHYANKYLIWGTLLPTAIYFGGQFWATTTA